WRQHEMKGTKNREAWNALITGLHYYQGDTRDGIKRAVTHLKEAVRLDPKFAQPYAVLAEIYRNFEFLCSSKLEAMTKGQEAALQALKLDPSMAQAHKEVAYFAAFLDRDFSKAESEFKLAIKMSPTFATAHGAYAWMLVHLRRFEEATNEVQVTLRWAP